MTGQQCHAHIATDIHGRAPVLCPRWLPGFALACIECGTDAPGVRLARFVANPPSKVGGEVSTVIREAMARPRRAAREAMRRPAHPCGNCGEPGHYATTCKRARRAA